MCFFLRFFGPHDFFYFTAEEEYSHFIRPQVEDTYNWPYFYPEVLTSEVSFAYLFFSKRGLQ
jgi:hypothetical protein